MKRPGVVTGSGNEGANRCVRSLPWHLIHFDHKKAVIA